MRKKRVEIIKTKKGIDLYIDNNKTNYETIFLDSRTLVLDNEEIIEASNIVVMLDSD